MKKHVLFIFTCIPFLVFAQTDTTKVEEIDFSEYANVEPAPEVKRFCTSKVLGQSPNKLLSIGYDYGLGQDLNHTSRFSKNANTNINGSGGLRLAANVPVISNTKWLVTAGANYASTTYNASQYDQSSYFTSQLIKNGLTTLGINTTVFKPLNDKKFLLAFASADANGAFQLNNENLGEYLQTPTYTVAAFYGIKRNDRSIIAFGVSRTYRPGALGYIPLILFNHTFESRKWGIEALFPARLALRRSFNPRNILFIGYELEGNSYRIIDQSKLSNSPYGNLQLRRSEIRPRITFERAVSGFIWFSAQVGMRLNYNFNVDDGDILRVIGDKRDYYMDNTLSNAMYFNIGLHLVSP
jgi:Domain of unknown function (DUF6268)